MSIYKAQKPIAPMKTPIQIEFPGLNRITRKRAHGEEKTRSGRRKEARPFDPKQALHVTLRSQKARGDWSMLRKKHCNAIMELRLRLEKRWNVRVYRYANVGNHLHLLMRAKRLKDWQGFIREFTGGIAILVTGARKGAALKRNKSLEVPESAMRGFWDGLVYTRIVTWGRDFRRVCEYIWLNIYEARGIPIREKLKHGFKLLSITEDSLVAIHAQAPPEILRYLEIGAGAVDLMYCNNLRF